MKKQYIVMDLEMNPVAKANKEAKMNLRREIIEIGAVKLDEDFSVIDKFRSYVKPQYSKEISKFITYLTGISASESYNAPDFETALKRFSAWIGCNEDTTSVIYSWSPSDLQQLQTECKFKQAAFPQNMENWIDFQAVYSETMGYPGEYKQIALHTAAEQFGIKMDEKRSHSALYDAEITADLLELVLTGEYVRQKELLHQIVLRQPEPRGCAISDCCGEILQQLLSQMSASQELTPAV